jgi:hypothetical protein
MRARKLRAMRLSTGQVPQSPVQATRRRDRSMASGLRNMSPSTARDSGSVGSKAACAESSRQVSATVLPIGPSVGIMFQPWARLSVGTRPGEGRKPTTPQNAAGMRSDPPPSEPVQIGSMPVASATAEPPEEPPGMRFGSKGLPEGP